MPTNKQIANKRLMFGMLLFLLLSSLSVAQQANLKFTHISKNHGLSHLVINFINQDKEGFIWMGSDDGLNRYDGYQFKVYRSIPGDSNSLSGNIVTCFLQADDGNIWLGTKEGLNKLNPLNDHISRYKAIKEDATTLSHNIIHTIVKDHKGFLWIGTAKGIDKFDPNTGKVIQHISELGAAQQLYMDKQRNLWIKTPLAIYRMSLEKGELEKLLELSIPKGNVVNSNFDIYQDDEGDVLIGTNQGLYQYSYQRSEFVQFKNEENDRHSLSNDVITSIMQDEQGSIWIGTYDGLNEFDKKAKKFYRYKQQFKEPESLSSNRIRSIFQDQSGAIWIGTFGSGVNKFNPYSKNFQHYKTPDRNIKNPFDKNVWAVLEDVRGNVWWGTNHGLYVTDKENRKIKFIGVEEDKDKGLTQEFVTALYQDSKGNLWVGTYYGVAVLRSHYVDRIFQDGINLKFEHLDDNEGVTSFLENTDENKMWIGVFNYGLLEVDMTAIGVQEKDILKNGLPESELERIGRITVYDILKKGNTLWLGTSKGLLKYDLADNSIEQFKYEPDTPNTISHNKVYSLTNGSAETIWLATYGGGVNEFNTKTDEVRYYTTNDGLSSNVTYSILEDKEHNFWISTNNGLSKFNKTNNIFITYDVYDGIQSHEFNQGAYYLSKEGEIYLGGSNGISAFYPEAIGENDKKPKVVWTDFFVFNKQVQPGKEIERTSTSKEEVVLLQKDINVTEKIEMPYDFDVFSIEFAATDYLNPKRNKFEYQLVGFDKQWIATKSDNRKITYTNLDPGVYDFKVRAANKDGVWSLEPKQIKLIIQPPFWKTIWFYIVITTLLLVVAYLVFKAWMNRVRLVHLENQNELKTAMLKETHHRVKNNLHVVKSLLRMQAASINDPKVVDQFKKAQSRIISMATLHEKMYKTQSLKEVDVQEHFEVLANDLIEAYGTGKEVLLELDVEHISFNMETLVPLSLIINELISNSLKYAFPNRDQGMISIQLKKSEEDKRYVMIVGDNGIGFKEDNEAMAKMGANLVKTFVKQLKGTITHLDQPGAFFEIVFQKI